MPTDNQIGDILRKIRAEKKLGLREAAREIGINHGHLYQIETSRIKSLTVGSLKRISETYGLHAWQILKRAGI